MTSSNHHLTRKLALLKLCGWLITGLACLAYFPIFSQTSLPLPLWLIFSIGGAIACGGLIWSQTFSTNPDQNNFIFLLTDILFLSAVIHYTGAITNPFTSSLLVPVALGIALLPKRYAVINTAIACGIYVFWLLSADHHNMMHHNFSLHLYGMGINFLLSALLLFIFVSHALATIKKQESELNSTREKMINDEQLIGIASLTANTAHALGTPLQTLTIITDDLTPKASLDAEDLQLIKEQIKTCKGYLRQLTHTAELAKSTGLGQLELGELNTKLEHHYSLQPHQKELTAQINPALHTLKFRYNESLFFAIINLIDNALKAAHQSVHIDYQKTTTHLIIQIADDGAGIPESVISSIGQPFINNNSDGLGLGYYLSNYSIEKCQGELRMTSREPTGTITEILLPRLKS